MNPQFAVVLGLMVSGAALFAGFTAQRGERYFPVAYETETAICDADEGSPYAAPVSAAPILSDWEAEWYGAVLSGLDERPLYRDSVASRTPSSVLRFTWIRSFDPAIVIRIESKPDGAMRMVAKQAASGVAYRAVARPRHIERDLSQGEVVALRHAAAIAFEQAPIGCEWGADGSRWVFEKADDRDYQMVSRWSPQGGPVHALGATMLGLTGWEVGRLG